MAEKKLAVLFIFVSQDTSRISSDQNPVDGANNNVQYTSGFFSNHRLRNHFSDVFMLLKISPNMVSDN